MYPNWNLNSFFDNLLEVFLGSAGSNALATVPLGERSMPPAVFAEGDEAADPGEDLKDAGEADGEGQQRDAPPARKKRPPRRHGAPARARTRMKAQKEGLPNWFWVVVGIALLVTVLLVIFVLL